MARITRFSKDPKVKLIPIDEMMWLISYYGGIDDVIWKGEKPRPDASYFYFTEQYLVFIDYGYFYANYGMDIKEKLECINVAIRDGKTEYDWINQKLDALQKERAKHKYSKKLDAEIERMRSIAELLFANLPKYSPLNNDTMPKPFNAFLVQTGVVFKRDKRKKKRIVFDVETNGTRVANDDLLSLSIYDPSTGLCYNRFFPLDLQPLVLTTYINGIDDKQLQGATHLTQAELDEIIDFFDLKNAVLLSYSGGQGTFDQKMMVNYCKRHGISGFENLHFENIKSHLPKARFGLEGQLTKDNVCNMLGIAGVSDVHTGINDCILEWKLFERISKETLFFIDEHLYRFQPGYIIPVTYLTRYYSLREAAGIECPPLTARVTSVFEYRFPKKALKTIKKFPTNITGITIEHAIDSFLDVREQDNYLFLAANKRKLEHIGSLKSKIETIPVTASSDGLMKSLDPEHEEYIEMVNEVTRSIMEYLPPVIDFVKANIFCEENILSQEMVISEDRKVLALCDLSSKSSVMEIKTFDKICDEDSVLYDRLALQLFYESKHRKTYLMTFAFDNNDQGDKVQGLTIKVYSVSFE